MRRLAATLLVAVVALSAVSAVPMRAGLAAGGRPADPGTTAFLPVVARTHRPYPECTPSCPFSLQIAALHQVAPGNGAQAEWQEWYAQAFPALVTALEQSGACWTRLLVNWSLIEPNAPLPGQPPAYQWNAQQNEDRMRRVAETGVQIIGTIDFVPAWARGEPFPDLTCTSVAPERLADFGQFVTDLVNRYKEPPFNIHTWELRNEPDGTTEDRADVGQGCAGFRGDLYTQMLAVAYPAIKSADPGATVLAGGVAYDAFVEYGGPFYRYFPDEVAAAGGAELVDALNLHYFADFAAEWERWVPNGNPPTCGDVEDGLGQPYAAWGIDLIAKVNHFRNRMSACFAVDKPVWVTELAEHGYPGDAASLEQQARYVIQGYARGLAAGVSNITWFALVSPPYDSGEQGLLYQVTLEAKPAFFAYQTLSWELRGYEYAWTQASSDELEAYVFRNAAGAEKRVAWGSGVLSVDASQVRVVNRSGQATDVRDGGPGDSDGQANGTIALQMTAEPVFVSR